MSKTCKMCGFLKEGGFRLLEMDNWIVILSEDQKYLGRCLVILKRHCAELSGLTMEEQREYFDIVKKLEEALKGAFGAVGFNWSCLMNNSFKEKPWNPHIHWHFRPRYDKKVEISGEVFEDKEFGHHYNRETRRSVSEELIGEIAERIKSNLS